MHGPTRDRLEELLNEATYATRVEPALRDHVSECGECKLEVNEMRAQAEWIRSLKATEELEPAPGFYARVLQRIEERAKRSIWYGLVYSPIGKRLAYASLSLALVLGFYVIAAEETDHGATTTSYAQLSPEVSAAPNPDEQRDAVLVNFASYAVPSSEVAR